ncbi:hypothetical protein FIS3754_30700 [Fischerella sp. NIES-3754]|nr:hypothetical protein FIS3754_30700 [Fischerella sp. NIES-3754]BCX09468.1 MAG: hypothetical protein KatS3mg066_3327 [Fischerella sp.]
MIVKIKGGENTMLPKVLPNLKNVFGSVVEDFGIPGIVAVIVLPIAIPVVAVAGKSLTKTAIKGGIVLYENSRRAIAAVSENFKDIVAEARAELPAAENSRHLRRIR